MIIRNSQAAGVNPSKELQLEDMGALYHIVSNLTDSVSIDEFVLCSLFGVGTTRARRILRRLRKAGHYRREKVQMTDRPRRLGNFMYRGDIYENFADAPVDQFALKN